jgi:uncharacterized protein with PIN domain
MDNKTKEEIQAEIITELKEAFKEMKEAADIRKQVADELLKAGKTKQEFFNDMQKLNEDKAVCLRCRGQMYKLKTQDQPKLAEAVETMACTQCGKIENFFNPEMLKTFIEVKNDG